MLEPVLQLAAPVTKDASVWDTWPSLVASPPFSPAPGPCGLRRPVTFEDEEADLRAAMAASLGDVYQHDGLFDHEVIMQAIYASQGIDMAAVKNKAEEFLEAIGLRPHDLGIKNTDEQGNALTNQCFYLCLAHGYLGSDAAHQDVSNLALKLRRSIEAAVLIERPTWVGGAGQIGQEAMAFSDFLPIAMQRRENSGEDSTNILAELAVCILDSTAGHVEVYIGPKYKGLESQSAQAQNLILLWYTPGHYQCLVCNDDAGGKVFMAYDEFKELLSKHGVAYIETLE